MTRSALRIFIATTMILFNSACLFHPEKRTDYDPNREKRERELRFRRDISTNEEERAHIDHELLCSQYKGCIGPSDENQEVKKPITIDKRDKEIDQLIERQLRESK